MRRSLFAGIGVAAVLIFAACSTDEPSTRGPLAPTVPSLAAGQQCKNTLANAIEAKHDQLFSEEDEAILNTAFDAVQSECSTSSTTPSANLLAYMQTVVDKRVGVDPAALVALWDDATLYATGTPIGRPAGVFAPGEPATTPGGPYTRSGGAAVLNPAGPLFMYTFDGQAGIKISSTQTPTGPHLWTLYVTDCPETSLRPATPDCYEVDEYPEATNGWSPAFSMGMCMRHTDEDAAVLHEDGSYTEALPDGAAFPWDANGSCTDTHAFMDTWLGRKAGPLGRALARSLDYLRPQPLFADDAGESGLGLFTSPFGGGLTVIFEERFDVTENNLETSNNLGPFLNGTDPDVGDNPSSWDVFAPSPGFINVVDAATFVPAGPNVPVAGGGLLGQVIALSQAQGACKKNCPTYKLLGTRVNPTPADLIGAYQVTWQSLQNKPSIKEAPFLLLSASGVEIARLSYVTQNNQNRILYNGVNTGVLWTQNAAQSFKIVVRLVDDDPATTNLTTDLYIGNMETPVLSNVAFKPVPVTVPPTPPQTTFSTLGYRLDGIDAGVILADNFVVTRLRDKP
jgi:hypothetical protein